VITSKDVPWKGGPNLYGKHVIAPGAAAKITQSIESHIEAYAPGFKDSVLAPPVIGPKQMPGGWDRAGECLASLGVVDVDLLPVLDHFGQVIERLSGEDFEVYMDKNVLRPLDMRNSYYDTTPQHLLKHRSHSYSIAQDGKMIEGIFDMDTGITVSNGGLNAPLPDMVKYLNFLRGSPYPPRTTPRHLKPTNSKAPAGTCMTRPNWPEALQ